MSERLEGGTGAAAKIDGVAAEPEHCGPGRTALVEDEDLSVRITPPLQGEE